MILYLLSYLGGALTIISPCILPVLPFVFARADKPFLQNGLPMLVGMALMFAGVATLAAVGGGWAVSANQYGRDFALVLLALFGLTLLFPSLSDRAMQPLVRFGSHLSNRADAEGSGVGASLLLGVATGLLWAPCAGPILGLVLTGAALEGASATTTLLLVAYALGAATSLALALLIGGRLFKAMKRSLGAGEWIKRALGLAVLVAVAAIALGVDTSFLTRASIGSTSSVEQSLLDRFEQGERMKDAAQGGNLADEGPMPSLAGANAWLNSPPLTPTQLKGKVVVVDFWTYSCINCLRAIPYVRAWAQKYKDQGLVVIGVHAPEFAFEKDITNVRRAIADLGITYPVAIDNDRAVWRAFQNHYWPAHYFIDAKGRIRHHHYGEGDYAGSERVIQALLAEANPGMVARDIVAVKAAGAEAAAGADVKSPETYIGYARSKGLASPGGFVRDTAATYQAGPPTLNAWSLTGGWTVAPMIATAQAPGAGIGYRFHARDLHLVLGGTGKPVRFRVLIDGHAPGADHGVDVDAAGNGVVTDHRLYQLVRQSGAVRDRDFSIEFLDSGVQAFAFTFG
jgi:cytochrome c biogenesis protein CcdA/thiol-disulfide isomerase/thioredoxin